MKPTFTNPATGAQTEIPSEILCENGEILTITPQKKLGWTPGGWYQNQAGKEFMVKFYNSPFCYIEKLINDLAQVCIGEEFVPENISIGHGNFLGKTSPCLVSAKVENYQDLIAITGQNLVESVALRKAHAVNFHRFYAFCALLSNDDLNEENLGIRKDENASTPFIVDYGALPRFLHEEQIDHASTPFYLASLIGHRNLAGMQLVRRRYFGHDDFLDPLDRLKPQKSLLKPEDISYLGILDGVKNLIANQEQIIAAIDRNFEKVKNDPHLENAQKESHFSTLTKMKEILPQRIGWMKENFSTDLELIEDQAERKRFDAVKWRLHPKFAELMKFEADISQKMAQTNLEENVKGFSELIGRNREEFIKLDLRDVEKSDLQKFATENFMLHNAIAANDFEMANWLVKNDMVNPNVSRTLRTHNYHLFNLTPLNAAISCYHDALYYEDSQKTKTSLFELIGVLREKFFEKNGDSFDPDGAFNPVKITFVSNQKLDEALEKHENNAATKIQKFFKAHQAKKLSAEENKEAGRE